jgi:hypothetical protein
MFNEVNMWLPQWFLPILVATRVVRMREGLAPVLLVSPRLRAFRINYGTRDGTQQLTPPTEHSTA